jgi:hypothetical protein
VAIGGGDEARGHVVAEKCKLRDVGSVLDRQDAAGVAAVLRVPERGVDTEGDAKQVDALLWPKFATFPVCRR